MTQNSHFLKLEVGFFSSKKSFSQIFQNTAHLSYLNFNSVNFHKNQRNFFGSEYPRFINLKLDFFPVKKSFSQIFQISAHLFYLNFISVNFHKNQRNFFAHKKIACYLWGFWIYFSEIPPILKLEVGFFSSKKMFFTDFPNSGTFIPSKLYFWKNSQKIRGTFFSPKTPDFGTWSRIFFQ